MGPYSFLKHRVKVDPRFTADGQRVQYREYTYHLPVAPGTNISVFNADGSITDFGPARPSTDVITTLNLALVGATAAIRALPNRDAQRWLQVLAETVEGWGDDRIHGLFSTRSVGVSYSVCAV